jgi:hypothetical protein
MDDIVHFAATTHPRRGYALLRSRKAQQKGAAERRGKKAQCP